MSRSGTVGVRAGLQLRQLLLAVPLRLALSDDRDLTPIVSRRILRYKRVVRLVALATGVGLGVVLTACVGEPEPTPSSQRGVAGASERGIFALPTWLSGKWCVRSDPADCFDSVRIGEEFPQAFTTSIQSVDSLPEVMEVHICLEPDLGDGCTTAASMFLRYFPAGSEWNCQAMEADPYLWPRCEPDFSDSHETALERIVRLPNHQQNDNYVDSEPLYKVQTG